MDDEKIKYLSNIFIDIVKKSTDIYYQKNYIECKDKHKFEEDDVTNLDIQTQNYIISEAKKIIPNISAIGEEGEEISIKFAKI